MVSRCYALLLFFACVSEICLGCTKTSEYWLRSYSSTLGAIQGLLRRVWRLSRGASLVACAVGCGLIFPHFVVNEAAGETRDRADAGAQPGIACNSADDRTASRAHRCARERPLLGLVHVGAAGQRQRRHRPG